jgi:hypothetical protein
MPVIFLLENNRELKRGKKLRINTMPKNAAIKLMIIKRKFFFEKEVANQ